MYKALLMIELLLIIQNVYSQQLNSLDSLWFKPSLEENHSPICADIFQDAKSFFVSDKPMFKYNDRNKNLAGMTTVSFYQNPDIDNLPGDSNGFIVMMGGEKYTLRSIRHPGCGGACERYQTIAYGRYGQELFDDSNIPDDVPPPVSWEQLYRDNSKVFWLYSIDDEDSLRVYKLLQTGIWGKMCKIRFRPADISKSSDTDVQSAYEALEELKMSVSALTHVGNSWWCGSSRTPSRWFGYFKKSLPTVLYRPWSLVEKDLTTPDIDGSYSRLVVTI